MRNDFESSQSLEIEGPDDSFGEPSITIGLECATRSNPGQLSGPPEHCYPPEGPEFELASITFDVPVVNSPELEALELTYFQFCAIYGEEVADALICRATDDAIENGGF